MLYRLFTFTFFCWSLLSFGQYAYIENPELFQENTLDAHASFIFDTQEEGRQITQNPNYLILNGDWLFHHSMVPEERPVDFYQTTYNTEDWATIPVPGDWQMYDYDYPIYTNWKYPFKPNKPNVPRDFNPVGSYKKNFSLPTDWDTGVDDIILHFGGVNSCFFVWLNGQYLGYSEDSKLPSEFLASSYLQNGQNQIAVEVYKYCDGTYLEDQDMWRLSGIERDVYLYKQPEVSIEDLTIQASLDESYSLGNLSLEIHTAFPNYSKSTFSVECQLIAQDSSVLWQRYFMQANGLNTWAKKSLKGQISDVQQWSAQHPNLYTLVVCIRNEQNDLLQKVVQKVGFRSLEIKDGIFYINGDTALIKGVNRHEHDPNWGHAVAYTGNAFNEDSLRTDLELIKSLNFNAVRTAHYPNHPIFYDLCDEIGLYVCDEANVEGHYYMMFAPFDNLAIDPDYREAILSRIYNMYQRDKNHPSIIMWSVGNENGTGKTIVEAYKMLKELDHDRPVFNERHFFMNTIKEKHSDFNGHMYAPIDKVEKIIKKDKDKPFIWIEYAHAMGNSTGNFNDLWDFVRSEPQVQGGFIWDWRDQGIWKTNENGQRFLAYGGHFEPEDHPYVGGLQGDGNFCANGVISADGKLHPGADAIKHAQSNVQIEMVNDTTFRFTNDFEAYNLSEFDCLVNWRTTDGQGHVGKYNALTCAPNSDTLIQYKSPGDVAFISFSLFKNGNEYVKNFFLKDFNQPQVNLGKELTQFKARKVGELNLVGNDKVEFVISEKGTLHDLSVDDVLKFVDGPRVNFWRALTDNDYGNKANKRLAYWRSAEHLSELIDLSHGQADNYYAVVAVYELPEKKGTYRLGYKIYSDGLMEVNLDFDLKWSEEIPRIGSYMLLPADYDLIHYVGMGPNENYIDRQDGQRLDEFYLGLNPDPDYPDLQIQEMPYIRPQEYGNRTKTFLVNLYAPNDSLRITCNDLSFSAWPHNQADIDAGAEKQGKTSLDVPKRAQVCLNIDYGQTGVGGDNSWGRKPYDQYMLKAGTYSYSFTFDPR
ncbi:hypothetical protein OAT96_01810 [Chitinophagales bacterium]|nr:hypothetical protein [Chitinophagales bacterium]